MDLPSTFCFFLFYLKVLFATEIEVKTKEVSLPSISDLLTPARSLSAVGGLAVSVFSYYWLGQRAKIRLRKSIRVTSLFCTSSWLLFAVYHVEQDCLIAVPFLVWNMILPASLLTLFLGWLVSEKIIQSRFIVESTGKLPSCSEAVLIAQLESLLRMSYD